MTGREFVAWLEAHDAMDLPLVLRGFADVDDGEFIESFNTEGDFDESRLSLDPAVRAEVTVWCP